MKQFSIYDLMDKQDNFIDTYITQIEFINNNFSKDNGYRKDLLNEVKGKLKQRMNELNIIEYKNEKYSLVVKKTTVEVKLIR